MVNRRMIPREIESNPYNGRMKMTDKGEFAKSELTITPAANGSYLVRRNWSMASNERFLPRVDDIAGFSNYTDLLNFLVEDYRQANTSGASNIPPQDMEAGKP